MNLTEQGLALIRSFEGLRLTAYRDAGGIHTIGYGHTGRLTPPQVTAGMKITQADAESLLKADAEAAAAVVRRNLSVSLSDEQFSALVAFAFNVGAAAFARSSVLAAVNAGDFDAVPRRLGLWVKCAGKTLPGLVRRRAAEAALFMTPAAGAPVTLPGTITAMPGKPPLASTTNAAAVVSAATGTLVTVAGASQSLADVFGRWAAPLALAILIASAVWIIRERMKKSQLEGI